MTITFSDESKQALMAAPVGAFIQNSDYVLIAKAPAGVYVGILNHGLVSFAFFVRCVD